MRILVIFGVLLAGAVYFIADPARIQLPACPFYKLTHLYCPGCGSQRGLHALLHGDILAAIGYNPLMITGLIFLVTEYALMFMKNKGMKVKTLSSRQYTPIIAGIVIVTYWILRNIPVSPFTVLAP